MNIFKYLTIFFIIFSIFISFYRYKPRNSISPKRNDFNPGVIQLFKKTGIEFYTLHTHSYKPIKRTKEEKSKILKILKSHSKDKSYHDGNQPDLVIFPKSTNDVSKIMKICHKRFLTVTPCGDKSGLEGGMIPKEKGVVINLSKMKKIIKFYEKDLQLRIQPGILKSELNQYLKPKNMFFGVDPGSNPTIGGCISTGCSGTLGIKHGTIRENVVSLTVVTADGTILKDIRSRVVKSSAGYDLVRLFIGSEGTLGIITEAVVKVQKKPKQILAASFVFKSTFEAAEAIIKILNNGLLSLTRLELCNKIAIKAVNKFFKSKYQESPTIFMEFQANDKSIVLKDLEATKKICFEFTSKDSFKSGLLEKERNQVWNARRNAYFASYKLRIPKKGEKITLLVTDVGVPISKLSKIIEETEKDFAESNKITKKKGFTLHCSLLCHAGEGNFHLMVPYKKFVKEEVEILTKLKKRMIKRAISYGGTCTGEHSIGLGKQEALRLERGDAVIGVYKAIKKSLDPRNLLNPGKIF